MATQKRKLITKIGFFYRPGNPKGNVWQDKLTHFIHQKFPKVKIVTHDYQALIVLGGDGAVLEAARTCQQNRAIILGLNLGTVGFLASVRKQADFFSAITLLLKNTYVVTERNMLSATVTRKNKEVFTTLALNETAVLNPIGMVRVAVSVDNHLIQTVHGTGVLVSTATGSTAYNLSAHGPLVMPNAKNMIITELLDHGLPTPSVVLNDTQTVTFVVTKFRERKLLTISATGDSADVLLIADGEVLFSLEQGDVITITRAPKGASLVEFDQNYFLRSLRDKFMFS